MVTKSGVKVENPVSFCPQPGRAFPSVHRLLPPSNPSNHQEVPVDIMAASIFTVSHAE